MDILTPFIFLTFFSFFIYFLFFTSTKSKSKPQQGFKHFPFVGTLPLFLLNRHRFLDWSTEVLRNCRTNTAVYKRPGKVSRKTASYEFHTKSLRNFVLENAIVEIQSRLLPHFGKACETERILDLQDVLERFAFDNVCRLAFNYDPACLGGDGTAAAEFMRSFENAANLISGRFMYAFPGFYKVKKFFNIGSEKTLKESVAVVHKSAEDIIHSRLEEKNTTQIEND
ncbi:cytochrome P450 94A1-like [Cucumis melo var. makuwa]|uniref:Cytochrome P450 94A1-like n=1 Tax=Cucumis melo var. makuwa TaxID=1194695 RepID=A0A5D3DPD0_CUCMM|nr:cytochrome P450 94A1-like [Cucumis melo var. makuwa]TYK25501.1 cytochrome P450 94A1-like [Cucumis melo var. makuwa]